MVAMRRSVLAGLMVAVAALMWGCGGSDAGSGASSATSGTQAWLVGTWDGVEPNGGAVTLTFAADGSAQMASTNKSGAAHTDTLQYTIAGSTLSITEVHNGAPRGEAMDLELTDMTPSSFSMPRFFDTSLSLTRRP